MLEIKDLHVEVEGIEIIKGISLTFEPGKINALMGPNGSGKSTLAHALVGHPKYKITKGEIFIDGKEITHLKPDERAKAGLFLSFQYPPTVQGVTISKFLRTAVNAKREKPYSVVEFHGILKEAISTLGLNSDFIKRYLNHGFSGGEKKKLEILQMILLQPKYALLDETDSGLDVDAIRIVAEGIKLAHQRENTSFIVITHYHRFLEYLQPDTVSVLMQGKIVAAGGKELAAQIEKEGFALFGELKK